MKVLAFGSCMSNLTIAQLKSDFDFVQTHSVHHNRSDNFIRYFIDQSAEMIPYDFLDSMLRYKPEGENEARNFLLNQYREHVGFFELRERKTSPDVTFFSDLRTERVDVILMDNFMDIAAKVMFYKHSPEFRDSPLFINFGFFENGEELHQAFDWWGDYLTPNESAQNFVRIARWLRHLQPQAKIFFLPYHSCTSLSAPDRFARADDFYPALVEAARGEDIHIIPPLNPAPEHTKGESDWPHFQAPLYRALAGYVYLATIGRLPNPTHANLTHLNLTHPIGEPAKMQIRDRATTSHGDGQLLEPAPPKTGCNPVPDDEPGPVQTFPADTLERIRGRVQAHRVPEFQLFDELMALRGVQDTQMQIDLFESLVWQIDVTSSNPYRAMFDAYMAVNRTDAAFAAAASVLQLDKNPDTVTFMYQRLFDLFVLKGEHRQAVDVFLRHVALFPDHDPIAAAWQIQIEARKAGRVLPAAYRDGSSGVLPARSERIPVIPASRIAGRAVPVYGAPLSPFFLGVLKADSSRAAIDVVRAPDSRLLIMNRSVVVVDSADQPNFGLSFANYPELIHERLKKREAAGRVEIREVPEAILLTDRITAGGNLCHMLLDHVSRLFLYEKAGVDLSRALIVGAPRPQRFETEIFEHLGLSSYVDVDQTVIIAARELYVSTNCTDVQHAADRGADWAIGYLREKFAPARRSTPTRIFISRRGAGGRRLQNEPEAERLLRDWGFVTVQAELLGFMEQVRLFSGATHVVSPHGAGLTNAIFAPPGVQVLEIFHPLYGTAAYAGLAAGAGWSYAAMIGRDGQSDAMAFNGFDPSSPSQGNFGNRDIRVDLAELERWLQATA